jgi:putative tryptophan/tyrosine transport system substrate-binding protein
MYSDRLKRREFITLLGAAAAWPLVARAQELGRIYRLGCLLASPRDAPHYLALFNELGRLGFIEGQNLVIDPAGFGLSPQRMEIHAADLVKARVDLIHAAGDAAVRAAQRATANIPILAFTDDMLGQGFVRSLAKPGGNTTGVTILASELDGKRQEILIEAIPGARRIATLADSNVATPARLQALEEAARARGIALSIHTVARQEEIGSAIEAAKAEGAQGLNVLASSLLFNSRAFIFDRALALRLPAVYQWPEMADEGGLIGYGPLIVSLYRDTMSRQLGKLFRGAQPADLPVEQPTKFELVLNLKTAKAIGFDVPAALVLRADKVIE